MFATRKNQKMTIKSLLLIGTLALAGIASAKSYDINLSESAKAGSLQLAAGAYSVNVLGSIAVFTNVETGKKFIAAVNAIDTGKKFDATAVDCNTKNGAERITSVELGGSTTMLELGE
jgi:hypothetical protein